MRNLPEYKDTDYALQFTGVWLKVRINIATDRFAEGL